MSEERASAQTGQAHRRLRPSRAWGKVYQPSLRRVACDRACTGSMLRVLRWRLGQQGSVRQARGRSGYREYRLHPGVVWKGGKRDG